MTYDSIRVGLMLKSHTIGIVCHEIEPQDWIQIPEKRQTGVLDFECPNCERKLQLASDMVTRECRCPGCDIVFAPSSAERKNEQRKAIANEHEDSDEHNTLTERARFIRSLKSQSEEFSETASRWNQGKKAIKIGFPLGCAIAFMTLYVPPGSLFADFWIFIFWDGVIGACYAFMISWMSSHEAGRSFRWLRSMMVIVCAGWFVLLSFIPELPNRPVIQMAEGVPEVPVRENVITVMDPFGLIVVGCVGFPFIFLSLLFIEGSAILWRRFQR